MHGSCCSLLLGITDEAEVRRFVGMVRRNLRCVATNGTKTCDVSTTRRMNKGISE
jgi:hypothetical protein